MSVSGMYYGEASIALIKVAWYFYEFEFFVMRKMRNFQLR